MQAELSPWIRKLGQFVDLTQDDLAVMEGMVDDIYAVGADQDLKHQGDRPGSVHLVLDGLACRYKMLEDGRRQIVGFMVPGDMCDMHIFLLHQMDHSIATLCQCRIAEVSPKRILAAIESRPRLTHAFWTSTLTEAAVLREWLTNVGRRDAYERVAHLIWELFLRHAVVGRIDGATFSLPLTQQELADALGLSAVHVNRTLQRLKSEGIIELSSGRLTVVRPGEMQRISGFNPDYLHLDDAERERIGLEPQPLQANA